MLYQLKDIDHIASSIAGKVSDGDVIALAGELAAGKTTLTKAILKAMNYKNRVSSPTFVLEKRYPVTFNEIREVIHLDFYRLNPDQIDSFGWKEYLGQKNTLTIIEWPDRVKDHLPPKVKKFKLEIIDDQTRRLEIE